MAKINSSRIIDLENIIECLIFLEDQPNVSTKDQWLPAQHLAHCAEVINYSIHGYPLQNPVWQQKSLGKMVFHYFTWRDKMSHNINAMTPGATEYKPMTLAESIHQLRSALQAFERYVEPMQPHYFYGQLTKKEYATIHRLHFANHWDSFIL